MAETGRPVAFLLPAAARMSLVVLRTLIGWHFLYEGYYKLMLPGWSSGGAPVARWSAAGYLAGASGPFAGLFQTLADSPLLPWIDLAVMVGLVLVGLSLLLGIFTQVGCLGAMALLAMFYLAMIPLSGMPEAGAEGVYLLVNKTLVELAAVWVLFVFRTGRLAGLDLLRYRA